MEEIYRKEMGAAKWLIRLTERLTILTTSMRMKTDLGVTEEDVAMIKDLHRAKEMGYVPMFENIVINKEEPGKTVTQSDLFNDIESVTAKVDTIGINIDSTPTETIKNKENDKD